MRCESVMWWCAYRIPTASASQDACGWNSDAYPPDPRDHHLRPVMDWIFNDHPLVSNQSHVERRLLTSLWNDLWKGRESHENRNVVPSLPGDHCAHSAGRDAADGRCGG